ncbi:MAG TPA: dynamin family protein [Sporosarcina sp.]|nr:dynamin family protein [Sporosarcina sp.]
MIEEATEEGIELWMSNFEEQLQKLIEEAATCGKLFEKNEDEARFDKIQLFGEKLTRQEYMIGFAGHFSAGKSSMINALTGGDLLPSSPIPTSANIVKVRKAMNDYAIIHLLNGTATKYESTRFSEAIKAFSKNGDEVGLVEIGHHASTLPEGITVMDTPGVDSTDDRHQQSTESALHLADLVFYTMDYNHVQSELNFTFTKELLRYNPNVYLIINQIDKHRDTELPFEQFKQSVESSFNMWGVEPKGIFYTSLKAFDHPHNDFPKVKKIVDEAMDHWQENFIHNATQTLKKLEAEHQQFLAEHIDELKEQFSDVVANEEWAEQSHIEQQFKETKKAVSLVEEDAFSRGFDHARYELIENAAITPYEMREQLKVYLESLSPRFKVGFLFGAKKTEGEKQARRNQFYQTIQELLHTQINMHLKLLMKNSLKEAHILTDERSLEIDAMDLTISLDTIEQDFQPSDTITGDTVLNYAKQMKANIQLAYRRLTEQWREDMAQVVMEAGTQSSGKLQDELQVLSKKVNAFQAVDRIIERKEQFEKELQYPPMSIVHARQQLISSWAKELELLDLKAFQEAATMDVEEVIVEEEVVEDIIQMTDDHLREQVDKAIHVANVLADEESFASMAHYLKEKANRLDHQSFTVALFGAFSAGKSSFSNALIGEKILPVSPNPTTATINRIRPVEQDKMHDTADVVLKTEERMTEDLARSFEALDITVHTLEEAKDRVKEAVEVTLTDERLQVHKAFIAAFGRGYDAYRAQLGTTIHVQRDEFVRFVAEEERSCFVESIDFFYDCELTRHGITLVDTPGADSINARHTDVAFEYIRNADAILFVTYYNHAFARADQEFLIQLGRVKDAFELDKMFFIVNAIDLAKDEEEAEAVKDYVANELQKFGIRRPRVHGLSSIEALQAKEQATSYPLMDTFEQQFHQFLAHDLKGLAVQALSEEVDKTVERLALLIERTENNLLRKEERLEELASLEQQIRERYATDFSEVLLKNAKQEVEELVHYVHQRVFLRFNEFFRASYNPATFSRHGKEEALKIALQDLVEMVGFDLTQEMKVTNLRMSRFLTQQLMERQRREQAVLKEWDATIAPVLYEAAESEMLTFEQPFEDITPYTKGNRFYKNERSFFEKGESAKTKDFLEEVLREDAEQYLQIQENRLTNWQSTWISNEVTALQHHLVTESIAQINSERALLEQEQTLAAWRARYEQIHEKELV